MNLMLPTSSIPTAPMVNSTSLLSAAHANPSQAPSSSVLNFTLQHLGLMPATMQMSADPGLGSALIHQGVECAGSVSKSVDLKQGKALELSHELNGKPVLTIPLQQVRELLYKYLLDTYRFWMVKSFDMIGVSVLCWVLELLIAVGNIMWLAT